MTAKWQRKSSRFTLVSIVFSDVVHFRISFGAYKREQNREKSNIPLKGICKSRAGKRSEMKGNPAQYLRSSAELLPFSFLCKLEEANPAAPQHTII